MHAFLLERSAEGGERAALAVDEEDVVGQMRGGLHPRHDLVAVGVSGEALGIKDLGVDGDVLAVHAERLGALL